MLATNSDLSMVTTRIYLNQRIKGSLNNTWTAQKLVPESTIAQDLRKQRNHGTSLTSNAMTYFNAGMKLSRDERLKRANPEIHFGNW